jgi:outer membrane usher protein FimD/PapC
MELLLILNNKKFNPSLATITKQGVLFKVPVGIYRLDLDPAGYPLDWKPVQNAYAVEIVAGSYITISVPFVASYTLAGTVKDAEGKPIVGARVEAIDNTKSSFASITNSSGVFYLEQLRQGTYGLKVNNKSVEPNRMTINSDSPTLQELNLKLPNP